MMTYTYDPKSNIIHLSASGVLVRDDPISYFHAVAEDSSIQAGAIERVYFQNLEDIAFTYTDIEAIRDTFNQLKHHDNLAYTIFITDSDFTFGMARMIISVFDHSDHIFKIERQE